MKKTPLTVLLILGFLAACSPAQAPVQNTATAIILPGATPAPTDTPVPAPSATPLPTSTLEPTPTPAAAIAPPALLTTYLSGLVVNKLTPFDGVENDLTYSAHASEGEGVLTMEGVDYQGGVEKQTRLGEGQGLVFDYKIEPPARGFEFETYLEHGAWQAEDYRRLGVFLTIPPETDFWLGTQDLGKQDSGDYLYGSLAIQAEVWYQVALAVGKDGDFMCLVWDPAQPASTRYIHQPMGADWAGKDWKFVINGATGKMQLDNLMEISFDAIVQ